MKSETINTEQMTPDGPHYRTAFDVFSQSGSGWRTLYEAGVNLAEARLHAMQHRAIGLRAWLQVTHDLGRTWEDCADDGTSTKGST